MAFADGGGFELEALDAQPQDAASRQTSARAQDLYWEQNYWKQPYFRADYDYEDYAPAYCVGYSGCAQYGGRFEDSEKSLYANFMRIKGDSRLTWAEAMQPIRAAWSRVEGSSSQALEMVLDRLVERVAHERCAA